MTEEIRKAREELRSADERLYANQNRLRAKELALTNAKRLGKEDTRNAAALENEIETLKEEINRSKTNLQSLKVGLSNLVGELVLPLSPQQLVSQLDDHLPCLLLPVRIETRFMGAGNERELWIRVYPDDIAVHIQEKEFTRDEADSAVDYWTERTRAASFGDESAREQLEKGAWRALANSYGGTRAAWLASEIKRRAIEKEGSEDFSFLLIRVQVSEVLADKGASPAEKRNAITNLLGSTHPLISLIKTPITNLLAADELLGDSTRKAIIQTIKDGILIHLGFVLDELKPESWSRASRSEVMPDRFVLIGFTDGTRFERPFPNAIPNPLIVGPNPQNLDAELSQQNNDLVMGQDFNWIGNFDQAIQVGMGMRVTLPEPFASKGFDRLMVLGVRVSSEPAEHKVLLEELIESHHFAPDGMSFVPQGTPTNNTGEVPSGFSTDDTEGEASYETETKSPDIVPTNNEFEKTDAQRLAEALDVDLNKLEPLANAERKDVSQARVMNRALWPATLGYYLEELLELQPSDIGRIRTLFTDSVVARGSVPAIRVGKQPYGVLVTSAFRRWQVNQTIDGEDFSFLTQAHDALIKVEDQWQLLVDLVPRVEASGDSFANLLNILGLHPTSVDFARRLATYQTALWNLAHFWIGGNIPATSSIAEYFRQVSSRGIALLNQLGFNFPKLPRLFGLLFSENTSPINGPLVDDVETPEDEKLSETTGLPQKYAVQVADDETSEQRNYIGWLVNSDTNTLKEQRLVNQNGEALPIPTPLLYRMLHRSLLLSTFDATMSLYEGLQLVGSSVRREQDFTNVESGRTVTRWEFMEAPMNRVMPQISAANVAVGDFLATADVDTVPAAFTLQEVRDSISALEELKTAELERLFVEHLDLCSYRLDAWQTALFAKRLERLNLLRTGSVEGTPPRRGIHLGAYGWLENVRPGPSPVEVSPEEIPGSLREDGVTVVEQRDNGGYIHGPSINHAVAAAVLRNGYLTHADQNNADQFAVNLTSERVRIAASFLEGVQNGQELGALLGYQFERALHDRYVIDGVALEQFILAFRAQYPLVADKITPGASTDVISEKEANQVVDGYALLEAVLLDPPLSYPYGVDGLPQDENDPAAKAIIAEVERLKETFDSIADLSLAESVFQVTQGNFERAGAMLKALSEGNAPPEPEIVRTPRSGAVVNHKVSIHLETGNVEAPWPGELTPRAIAAPGLNKWLGELIGLPDSVQFTVTYDLDEIPTVVSLAELKLQPIDLIHLIGDQANASTGATQVNDLTELEARIDYAFRLKRKAADPHWDSSERATILFMSRQGFPEATPPVRTLFEMLPLLRNLKKIVTSCRPLGADDYLLSSEQNTDPNTSDNPKNWELSTIEQSLDDAAASLDFALTRLDNIVSTIPSTALSTDPAEAGDLSGIDYEAIRGILLELSYFGVTGAFPKNAMFPDIPQDASEEEQLGLLRARQSLIEQAVLTLAQGRGRHSQAMALRTFSQLTPEQISRLSVQDKAEIYQTAGALVLGDEFRFVPTFSFKNRPELQAAHTFANDVAVDQSLLRFTQTRLASAANAEIADWRALAVEEWFEGLAVVREKIELVDALNTFQEAFNSEQLAFKPLQLPFDQAAHWIALEFPEVPPDQLDNSTSFVPQGDFLSMARQLPDNYKLSDPQAGLLIDEWNEVIPNRIETTGIAIHYNQPNTEPPQCVLLAVSPVVDGRWEWDDLVETITDTFDRAKRRAVEPDFLRPTAYAQLLPAILSSFTSYPFGTISTNLAVQPVSMILDQS